MDYYKTSDKNLAAFLLLQTDIKFIGSEMDVSGICYFSFSPKAKATELESAFLSKSANPVQPKDLFDALKSIMDIIFKEKRNLRIY